MREKDKTSRAFKDINLRCAQIMAHNPAACKNDGPWTLGKKWEKREVVPGTSVNAKSPSF
jgi:hypothetical protein